MENPSGRKSRKSSTTAKSQKKKSDPFRRSVRCGPAVVGNLEEDLRHEPRWSDEEDDWAASSDEDIKKRQSSQPRAGGSRQASPACHPSPAKHPSPSNHPSPAKHPSPAYHHSRQQESTASHDADLFENAILQAVPGLTLPKLRSAMGAFILRKHDEGHLDAFERWTESGSANGILPWLPHIAACTIGRHIVISPANDRENFLFFPASNFCISVRSIVVKLGSDTFQALITAPHGTDCAEKEKVSEPTEYQEMEQTTATVAGKNWDDKFVGMAKDTMLRELGLEEVLAHSGGDCMFLSVAMQLPGISHLMLRQQLVDFIADNADLVTEIIIEDDRREAFMARYRNFLQPGMWDLAEGDFLIPLMARMVGINISLLIRNQKPMIFSGTKSAIGRSGQEEFDNSIIVTYNGHDHYNGTRKLGLPTRIFGEDLARFWLDVGPKDSDIRPFSVEERNRLATIRGPSSVTTQLLELDLDFDPIEEDNDSFFASICKLKNNKYKDQHISVGQLREKICNKANEEEGKVQKDKLYDPNSYDEVITSIKNGGCLKRHWEQFVIELLYDTGVRTIILQDYKEPIAAIGQPAEVRRQYVIVRKPNGYYCPTIKARVPGWGESRIHRLDMGDQFDHQDLQSQMKERKLALRGQGNGLVDILSDCLNEDPEVLSQDCAAAGRASDVAYDIPIGSTLSLDEIFDNLEVGIVFQEWQDLVIRLVSGDWKKMNVALLQDYKKPVHYCTANEVEICIANINGRYYQLGPMTKEEAEAAEEEDEEEEEKEEEEEEKEEKEEQYGSYEASSSDDGDQGGMDYDQEEGGDEDPCSEDPTEQETMEDEDL